MLSINFHFTDDYKPGDIGFTIQGDNSAWLVEVLEKSKSSKHYSRLTRMTLNPETNRYSLECSIGTYSFIPRKEIQKLRLDNVDFSSLASWQNYVDNKRDK